MAIAFRALDSGTGWNWSGSGHTHNIPATTADGDLLVLACASDMTAGSSGVLGTPTGWTKQSEDAISNARHAYIFTRLWHTGDPTTFTVPNPNGDNDFGWVIAAYSGVNQTTPVAAVAAAYGPSGNPQSWNSLTTPYDNCMLVSVFHTESNYPSGPIVHPGNGGSVSAFTPRANTRQWEANVDLGDTIMASAGATGVVSFPGWNAQSCTMLIALTPVGAVLLHHSPYTRVYLYENVGVNEPPTRDSFALLYENVGVNEPPMRDGFSYLYEEVLPSSFVSADGYVYANVGVSPVGARGVVAYAYLLVRPLLTRTRTTLTFTPVAGRTYMIQVSAQDAASVGEMQVKVTPSIPPPPPGPPNDYFAYAIHLPGNSGVSDRISSVDATVEVGEPNPSVHSWTGSAYNTLWWYWDCPSGWTGYVTFHTVASDALDGLGYEFNTVMGVYTDTALGDLVEVGSDDDDPITGTYKSRVTVLPTPGTRYWVQVSDYGTGPQRGGGVVVTYGPSDAAGNITP